MVNIWRLAAESEVGMQTVLSCDNCHKSDFAPFLMLAEGQLRPLQNASGFSAFTVDNSWLWRSIPRFRVNSRRSSRTTRRRSTPATASRLIPPVDADPVDTDANVPPALVDGTNHPPCQRNDD